MKFTSIVLLSVLFASALLPLTSSAQTTTAEATNRMFQCNDSTIVYLSKTECSDFNTRLGFQVTCSGYISAVKPMQSQPEWNTTFSAQWYPNATRVTVEDISFTLGSDQWEMSLTDTVTATLTGDVSDAQGNTQHLQCEEIPQRHPGPRQILEENETNCEPGPHCRPSCNRAC